MQLARFVRILVCLVMLGIAGFSLGCDSGSSRNSAVVDKAAAKQNAEEIKQARQDRKASRSEAKVNPMKGSRGQR